MSTSKDSSGRGEWRDTGQNRVLSNGNGARASSSGVGIATQSRASTNAAPAVASCRSGNRLRPSRRRNNQTYEFLQPARVSSNGQNEAVSHVVLKDEDLYSNLIYVEESPGSMNQGASGASVDSIQSGNRIRLDRGGRRRSDIRAQMVDLCGSVDASVGDTIVAPAGSSNGSAQEPRRKRNRELHENDEFSDKRTRISSAEGIVEENSAASAVRHTAFVPGPSRQRTSRFRKRSAEHRDATAQYSTNAATDAIVVDDLISPQRSANEGSRVGSEEDQERLRQMAADERLARELQGTYELDGGTNEGYDDEYLARLLQDEENSGILSGESITLNRRILLQSLLPLARNTHVHQRNNSNGATSSRARLAQRVGRAEGTSRLRTRIDRSLAAESTRRVSFPLNMNMESRVEVLAALEETLQEHLTGALQLMQVDRDFNENDYEMLLALDDNVRRGATQTKIELLPIRTILPTDVLEEVCSVCLELPVAGVVVRRLPCMHEFHQDCIDKWLRRQAACPVCKADIDAS